jgi:DNA-binding winged helix-turn-helix (wHTH) protein
MRVEGGTVLVRLRFGDFVLDEAGFALRRDDRPVEIEPRALKLLLHLARNRQRAVPRAELAAILWPDSVVSETSLKEAVNLARREFAGLGKPRAVP